MILEKIKNYFELKETFIISDSISIILNDLKNISENLPQKQPKKSNLKKKVEFQLLNQINNHTSKDNKAETIKNKTLRNYSTKSNGKKIINGPEISKLKLNDSSNFEELNYKINYVYLNMDKIKKPKLKIVRFADIDADIKTKRSRTIIKPAIKSNIKKYNLKKELNGKNAVYHNNLIWCCCYGYCGDDLAISGNFLTKNDSYCGGTNGKYMSFETSNLKMIGIDKEAQINFKVKELELFAIRNELTLKNNIETLREMRESLEDSLIIKNKEDILMIKSWLSTNSEG
jgi:hypothetical protein